MHWLATFWHCTRHPCREIELCQGPLYQIDNISKLEALVCQLGKKFGQVWIHYIWCGQWANYSKKNDATHITSPSPSRGQRPIDIGDELLDFWMKFQERLYLTLVHPAFVPSFCSFGPRLVISKFKLWNCVEWRQWWAFQFPFHITTSPCKKDVKAPPAYDSSPSLLDISSLSMSGPQPIPSDGCPRIWLGQFIESTL